MPVLDTAVVPPFADVEAAAAVVVGALAVTEVAPFVTPVLDADDALVVAGYVLLAAMLDEALVLNEAVVPDDVDEGVTGAGMLEDVTAEDDAAGVDAPDEALLVDDEAGGNDGAVLDDEESDVDELVVPELEDVVPVDVDAVEDVLELDALELDDVALDVETALPAPETVARVDRTVVTGAAFDVDGVCTEALIATAGTIAAAFVGDVVVVEAAEAARLEADVVATTIGVLATAVEAELADAATLATDAAAAGIANVLVEEADDVEALEAAGTEVLTAESRD